jgi:hypothetical protein
MYSVDEVKEILEDERIAEEDKIKLLAMTADVISVKEKNLSDIVFKNILVNHFDVNDLQYLAKDYEKYNDECKTAIYKVMLTHKARLNSIANECSKSLLVRLFNSTGLSLTEKANILDVLLENGKPNELIAELLVAAGEDMLARLFSQERSRMSSIDNNAGHVRLLTVLKENKIIDDFSEDKSYKIINNFKKRDKRINLIKNKKNMGTLYSRAIGGNIAKANYVIFLDSDDIVLKEGILNAYNHIEKHNLDIVQFLSIHQKNETIFTTKHYYKYRNVIKQPILSYIFYFNYTGVEKNIVLWDKLVKKQVVLNSLKYIGKKYIRDKIIIENDVILLYAIFKMANSYQFIKSFGYFYFGTNEGSIQNTWKNPKKSNEIVYSLLMNIKFLYEKTN